MLIADERHSTRDMAVWRENEAADLVAARRYTSIFNDALLCTNAFVTEAAYAAVSWGKDSTVLAHLSYMADRRIPLVWIRVEPIYNPDCLRVRDAFLDQFDANYHEIVVYCTHDEKGFHATGTLEQGARECEKQFGERRLTGIRANESAQRKLSASVHGTVTDRVCRPLLRWNAAHIFAYLANNNLPVHPAYAMTGGGRYARSRLRVASLGGKRGDGMGRDQWEQEYYGDALRRMECQSCLRK